MKRCIEEKDDMINKLTEKINGLLEQNIALNKKVEEDIKMRTPMNINVNILANKK